MKLEEIYKHPIESLIHMERYVNKGSPSGFTKKHTVSKRYDPRSNYKSFELPFFSFLKKDLVIFREEHTIRYPEICENEHNLLFPLHPDMIPMLSEQCRINDFSEHNISQSLTVFPTANGRTLLRLSENRNYYIKLHYHGIIGRINRALPLSKAIAGPEISHEIEAAVGNDDFPNTLAILPERLAIVKITNSKLIPEIGVIFREFEPFPFMEGNYLIPFFSLFSNDEKNAEDPFILCQIVNNYSNPLDAFENLINMILTGYLYLVFHRGYLPEINAQNVMLEITENGLPIRMVLRDLQGWEKDLEIRECNYLSRDFKSAPYKCICKKDSEKYFIRHSFSYDFKLGEYILSEIVDIFSKFFNVKIEKLEKIIQDIFHRIADGGDSDYFFPRDKWYCHEDILLTEKRPYVEKSCPKYRRS